MTSRIHRAECLACGAQRPIDQADADCPRCGYVGWAESSSLDERQRRQLRENPVHARAARRLLTIVR